MLIKRIITVCQIPFPTLGNYVHAFIVYGFLVRSRFRSKPNNFKTGGFLLFFFKSVDARSNLKPEQSTCLIVALQSNCQNNYPVCTW